MSAEYMEAWNYSTKIALAAANDDKVRKIMDCLAEAKDAQDRVVEDKCQKRLRKRMTTVTHELWNASKWGEHIRKEKTALFGPGSTLKTPTAFGNHQDGQGVFVDEQAFALAVFDAADDYLRCMSQPHYWTHGEQGGAM